MDPTSAVPIDPANTETFRAWDGDEGAYWAAHHERFDRSVAAYHGALLDAAAIRGSDYVLDIGCGTGQTTRDAARAAWPGVVLGVDLSSPMLAVAGRLAASEGLSNVAFVHADAQVHPFDAGAFDVAISRAGVMFFGDPVAAFRNIARALRPAARLALVTWQPLERSEWAREWSTVLAAGRRFTPPPSDAPNPFSLSDPHRVRSVLQVAGFTAIRLDEMNAPMHFGETAEDAARFLLGSLGWMLTGLDEAGRQRAFDAFHHNLIAHETVHGVLYDSAAWIITARKP